MRACSNDNDTNPENMEGMDHSNMNHSSSGKVPEGLKEAENPTFEVGSQAVLQTDHMEGNENNESGKDTIYYLCRKK